MPIYYNTAAGVDVARLISVLKTVANNKHEVVGFDTEWSLVRNDPKKKPVLLVLFVCDVDSENLIRTTFPLAKPARFDRIVVSLRDPPEKGAIKCDSKIVNSYKVVATPTDAQEGAFRGAVQKWMDAAPSYKPVREVLINPLQIGFEKYPGEVQQANELIGRIRASLAYAGLATTIESSEEAVGLVAWRFSKSQLDVNAVVKEIRAKSPKMKRMIIVWVKSGVPAGAPNSDVLLDVPAIEIKSGLNTDLGWDLTEENHRKVFAALAPFAREVDTPINWNWMVYETSKLLDKDTLRDWLGAVRWKPLPAKSDLSANEQYARMQALPPRDQTPSELKKVLTELIGVDPDVLTLTEELQRANERIDGLLNTSLSTVETKSVGVSKLQEHISRQDQVIEQLQRTEGKAKEQILVLETQVGDLKTDQTKLKEAHAQEIKQLTTKLQEAENKASKRETADLSATNQQLNEKVQQLTTKLQAAEAKMKETDTAFAAFKTDAKKTKDDLDKQIQELSKQLQVKQENPQPGNVDEELKELEKELEHKESSTPTDIDKLRADLKRKDELLAKVEKDLKAIQSERKLAALADKPSTELRVEIKNLATTLDTEKTKNQELQATIIRLMAENKEVTEMQAPMALKIDQLQQENGKLIEEKKSLNASIEKLLKANSTMTDEINDMNKTINAKSQQLAMLTDKSNDDALTRDWRDVIDMWQRDSNRWVLLSLFINLKPSYEKVQSFVKLSEEGMRKMIDEVQKSNRDAAKPKAE